MESKDSRASSKMTFQETKFILAFLTINNGLENTEMTLDYLISFSAWADRFGFDTARRLNVTYNLKVPVPRGEA